MGFALWLAVGVSFVGVCESIGLCNRSYASCRDGELAVRIVEEQKKCDACKIRMIQYKHNCTIIVPHPREIR